MRSLFENLFGLGAAVILLIAVAMVGFSATDMVYEYKAEPAMIACHQKQMDHARRTFTDSVVCVPYPMRRDTLQVTQ